MKCAYCKRWHPALPRLGNCDGCGAPLSVASNGRLTNAPFQFFDYVPSTIISNWRPIAGGLYERRLGMQIEIGDASGAVIERRWVEP